MLVILRENVTNLGKTGDVVRVSPGYARNFLMPRDLCVMANENNVAQIEHHKKLLEKKRLAEKSSAQELANKLAEFSINIARKVSDTDKLFGSVTSQDVHEALEKGGFKMVERRMIHMPQPIKALGVHTVEIKLDTDVTANGKVWVVKEA